MSPIFKFSRVESVIGPVQYADAFYDAVTRAELRAHPVPSIQNVRRRLSEAIRSQGRQTEKTS